MWTRFTRQPSSGSVRCADRLPSAPARSSAFEICACSWVSVTASEPTRIYSRDTGTPPCMGRVRCDPLR